jgi:hypothetical protein
MADYGEIGDLNYTIAFLGAKYEKTQRSDDGMRWRLADLAFIGAILSGFTDCDCTGIADDLYNIYNATHRRPLFLLPKPTILSASILSSTAPSAVTAGTGQGRVTTTDGTAVPSEYKNKTLKHPRLQVVPPDSAPSAAMARRTIKKTVATVAGALSSSLSGPSPTKLTSSSSPSTTDLRAVTADTWQERTVTAGGTTVPSEYKNQNTEASAALQLVPSISAASVAMTNWISNPSTTVRLVTFTPTTQSTQSFAYSPDDSDLIICNAATIL